MQTIGSEEKYNIGQLLAKLRSNYRPDSKALADALQTSHTTYLNIERGKRELSFLMALRLCQFCKLDLFEFIAMLSDEELNRKDTSIIKALQKRDRKKEELLKLSAGENRE